MAKARDFTIEFHESMGLTDVPGENDASRSKTFNQMDLRPGQTQAGTWFFSNSYSGAGAMAVVARLKNGGFVQYHAYVMGETPGYKEFCEYLKGGDADIYILRQNTGNPAHIEKQKQTAPILATRLCDDLAGKGKPNVHIVEVPDYDAVICDSHTKKVFVAKHFAPQPTQAQAPQAVSADKNNDSNNAASEHKEPTLAQFHEKSKLFTWTSIAKFAPGLWSRPASPSHPKETGILKEHAASKQRPRCLSS